MSNQLIGYLTVFGLSMLKFFAGPAAAAAFKMTVLESVILTVSGCMVSVLLTSFFGLKLRKLYVAKRAKKAKKFTRRKRMVVRIWKKFGLQGIAFFTPLLFTPIGGTLIAVSFGETIPRIFLHMLVSGIFWGIIFSFMLIKLGQHVPFLGI
jgi:hypothetical protein